MAWSPSRTTILWLRRKAIDNASEWRITALRQQEERRLVGSYRERTALEIVELGHEKGPLLKMTCGRSEIALKVV